jgi:hypothetical protein
VLIDIQPGCLLEQIIYELTKVEVARVVGSQDGKEALD